jgi:hypothetical protein
MLRVAQHDIQVVSPIATQFLGGEEANSSNPRPFETVSQFRNRGGGGRTKTFIWEISNGVPKFTPYDVRSGIRICSFQSIS